MEHLREAERTHSSSVDYAQLRAEAQAEVERHEDERPTLAQYEANAVNIARTRDYYRTHGVDASEAVALLKEVYVDGQESTHQSRFNELLIDTPQVAALSGKLTYIRHELQTPGLGIAERHRAIKHERELIYRMCEYNHQLRDVVESGRVQFNGPQLAAWIEKAGGPRNGWAFAQVKGAASEIAALEAAQNLEGLEWARYGEVEEDLRGADIVLKRGGHLVEVDVKSGHAPLEVERRGVKGGSTTYPAACAKRSR